jgi:hypothetical protein
MDLNKVLKETLAFSLINFKDDKKLVKYLAYFIIIYLAIALASALIYIGIGGLSEITALEQFMFIFTAVSIVYLPFMILIIILTYFSSRRGLEVSKKKIARNNLVLFLKYLITPFIAGIYALFSIFNLKFLLILLAGVVISLIGAFTYFLNPLFAGFLIAISFVFYFAYIFVIIYNSTRLTFTEFAILESSSIKKALKKSWKSTENNVLNIFIALIVFGIILSIISMVFQMPLIFYSMIFGFNQAIMGAEFSEAALYSDPLYWVLSIPSYLITAYLMLAGILFKVSLYTKIIKK